MHYLIAKSTDQLKFDVLVKCMCKYQSIKISKKLKCINYDIIINNILVNREIGIDKVLTIDMFTTY